jgi:hypothetical protein
MPMTARRAGIALMLSLVLRDGCQRRDGYDLWLRYPLVSNAARSAVPSSGHGSSLGVDTSQGRAARDSHARSAGLLGREVPAVPT